jgi:hypothetical protein
MNGVAFVEKNDGSCAKRVTRTRKYSVRQSFLDVNRLDAGQLLEPLYRGCRRAFDGGIDPMPQVHQLTETPSLER